MCARVCEGEKRQPRGESKAKGVRATIPGHRPEMHRERDRGERERERERGGERGRKGPDLCES
jgi:hypothetical protein